MATGRFFPATGVDLGVATSYATFNQSTLPRPGMQGHVIEDSGNVFKLVQRNNTADVATVAGAVGYYKDNTHLIVTSKASEALSTGFNGVAGGFLGVITNGNFCFIQIGGSQSISTAAAVVAGDKLMGSATDGQLARSAQGTAPTDVVWAIAEGAVSGGFSAARWLLGNLLC